MKQKVLELYGEYLFKSDDAPSERIKKVSLRIDKIINRHVIALKIALRRLSNKRQKLEIALMVGI